MLALTLPCEIAELRDHFAAQSTKAQAAALAWQSTVNTLAEKISEAATQLARAERDNPDNDDMLEPFREKLRRLKQERAKNTAPSFVDQWRDIERYLDSAQSLTAVPATVNIREGEMPLAAFHRSQRNADSLLRDIMGVRAAPKPAEDQLVILRAQVDALAAKGKPQVDASGRIIIPQTALPLGDKPLILDDLAALMAWACQDQLFKAFEPLASPADGIALTNADRERKLGELYERLANALRQESAAATEAEKIGQPVIRRKHVHPCILIGAAINPATVFDHLWRKRGS